MFTKIIQKRNVRLKLELNKKAIAKQAFQDIWV